jgi:hypothetical protein
MSSDTIEIIDEVRPAPTSEPVVEKVDIYVRRLYKIIKDRTDFQDILPTVIELMHEIEKIEDIKGPEKLELLQDTLRYAVMSSDLDQDKKFATLFMIKTVIPLAARAAILGSKNPVVAQVQAEVTSCLGRLLRR